MTKTNPVISVLVTSGNQSPIGSGHVPSDLALGQIGFFSYPSNMSLTSASTAEDWNQWYIAVGVDPNSTGAVTDIRKSAGHYIKGALVTDVTARCYSPALPKIVNITGASTGVGLVAKCGSEYGLKLNIINQAVYHTYGYNTPYKSFVIVTSPCPSDCTGGACDSSGSEAAYLMVQEINADPDQIVTAAMYDPYASVVVGTTAAQYATWVAANPTETLAIQLTTQTEQLITYASVNLKYDKPRMTDVKVSLFEGFAPNTQGTTVTIAQELVYEQGAGYDVAHIEEVAAGQQGQLPYQAGPYRTSALVGVAYGFNAVASKSGKYFQYTIEHEVHDHSNSMQTHNCLQTILAIPCADTTTRTNTLAVLDQAFSGKFNALSGYNTACPSCTTANTTDAIQDAAPDGLDGIGLE